MFVCFEKDPTIRSDCWMLWEITPRGIPVAPGVTDEMLKPDTWTDLCRTPDKVLMSEEEISQFNDETVKKMKEVGLERFMYDIRSFPRIISRQDVLELMDESSSEEVISARDLVDNNGDEVTHKKKERLVEESNIKNISAVQKTRFGILTRRQDLRAFPTNELLTRERGAFDVDAFQLTALSLGTPVAVVHESRSGDWTFVQSPLYKGWVRSDSIAFVSGPEEAYEFLEKEPFLVVTASTLTTEPDPYDASVSCVFLQMGDRVPIAAPRDFEANIQAQGPQCCYSVLLPVRGESGMLEKRTGLIPLSADVRIGFLPPTRANVIRQAFKMLGERYGWGCAFGRRDCSRYIMDIFRTVGLRLPRNTRCQEQGTAGKTIEFSGSIAERLKIADALEPGDAIYMKGHVLIYLGKYNGSHYVIHDGAGYAVKEGDKIVPVSGHSVFVMQLEQLVMSGQRTYLEAATSAKRFLQSS